MVFLLHGLPPFLARAGPQDLGGGDGKGMVGTLSIGPREQVCGLLMSTGYRYLCKHNSGRNKDIIFPLLESQSSKAKLSEKPGLWVFPSWLWP